MPARSRDVALWLLAIVLFACGCSRGGGQRVDHFTLDVPGLAPRTVDLPVHLAELPDVAPELSGGTARLSPAVDVFSFGVVAYGMLTGKLPFVEPPLLARLAGREPPLPPPVVFIRPEVPESLARAVDACLAPDPGGRPSIGELLARLSARSIPA